MDIDKQFAIKLGHELQYINTRKEYGLSAHEMLKSIKTEDFIRLAEAYIELCNIRSSDKPQDNKGE